MRLAYASLPFSISGYKNPSFHLHFFVKTSKNLFSGSWKPLSVWVWLPTSGGVVLVLLALEASFSSQHSGASLFRAFLLLNDRITLSSHPLPSCTSDLNPTGLDPVLQGLALIQQAVLLFGYLIG